MVTLIYQDADGVYRASLSGRRIKGNPADPKKYQIVGPEMNREHRAENIRRAADRLGRVPRDPAAEAGAAARPPRPPGIRASAAALHAHLLEGYMASGPNGKWDAPDKNTVRMLEKLRRYNPQHVADFDNLRRELGAHYYRYNPVSHAFELYSHRQVYKGSYMLPLHLRSRKVKGPIQAYKRSLYREGPTKTFMSRPGEPGVLPVTVPITRPPGSGRLY